MDSFYSFFLPCDGNSVYLVYDDDSSVHVDNGFFEKYYAQIIRISKSELLRDYSEHIIF